MSKRRAPYVVAGLLLIAYALTLAPGVTFWDSGEFLAAMKTLGIPHPPGTPLYILFGNVWARLFGPLTGFALSINLLSAISSAAACGIFTLLMLRWSGNPLAAVAGGLLAGLMSSVWMNANETEVYAPALLMSALLLLTADNARRSGQCRWIVLLAYLCGLSWSLQLSALVAAPAALVLAASFDGVDRRWIARAVPASVLAAALGATVVFFMLLRAPHDPAVNQGDPSTWSAFVDVITRAQYRPVSVFPRQAPWLIQIGNLFEYADWQVAFGLHPDAPPSWRRTPFTIAYAALGAAGLVWHRGTHRSSWRAMIVLFICATLGVITYLNMKASPSFGHGVLPPDAKHEARERDYFFALAFVCWGLWAGAGAVALFRRLGPRAAMGGVAIASLPFALNFRAVDRSSPPESTAARDSAMRILRPAPANAVVFAYGDNDTYPVWYAQQVEQVRRDVSVVTIPLLGAKWYRAELLRRDRLLTPDFVSGWRGYAETVANVCTSARERGRPVVSAPIEISGLGLPAAALRC